MTGIIKFEDWDDIPPNEFVNKIKKKTKQRQQNLSDLSPSRAASLGLTWS